jgi:hypothetical protein
MAIASVVLGASAVGIRMMLPELRYFAKRFLTIGIREGEGRPRCRSGPDRHPVGLSPKGSKRPRLRAGVWGLMDGMLFVENGFLGSEASTWAETNRRRHAG